MDSHESALRVAELLDVVLDSESSEAQNLELDALIRQDPELAREVAAQLRFHSLLEWEAPQISSFATPGAPAAPATRPFVPPARPRAVFAAWAQAAAAAIIIAGGAGLWYGLRDAAPQDGAIAEIVDDRLVDWGPATDALTADRRVRAGRVEIESGTLTLRFRSGATVNAIGPATMRIESDMLVRLDSGQATAHVPHWAAGFTVETPDVEIVDLGTEFGVVARRDGKTDVVVFDGEVDLTPVMQRAGGVQKRLTQGEGVSVTNEGGIDRIVQLRRDTRGESWSTEASNGESVFAEIHDNMRRGAGAAKYYQITPGGLDEDSLAYVDRPHQWNGLSGDGLPEVLQHVDYVRTFNDDKYVDDVEIVIDLAQPAWLYVLFDDRVPLPTWLTDQFEDTGVDVGLDEGPWIEADMSLATAIGSGNSVDRVFSVWRRRCDKQLSITLGSMGHSPEARAMYGIAARPIE